LLPVSVVVGVLLESELLELLMEVWVVVASVIPAYEEQKELARSSGRS
jgi:hypothetical protein